MDDSQIVTDAIPPATPAVKPATAGTSDEQKADTTTEDSSTEDASESAASDELGEEQTEEQKAAAKPPKTPEQRELDKARRRIDRLTKRLHERDAIDNYRSTQEQAHTTGNDDEPVTLSRAELQRQIQEAASKMAPTIKQQEAVIEHRKSVIAALDKDLGTERFNEVAADLDEALGGLADQKGQPKPVAEAIFEAENPRALVEYLADPDNEDEAHALSRMSGMQLARAMVKIEAKLSAKPQPSKAAEPLSAVKAAGAGSKTIFEMSDSEFFKARRNHGKR